MKKYFVAGAIILSMVGIQFADANMIYTPPAGKEYVQVCLVVQETHPMPQFTIVLRKTLYSRSGLPGPPSAQALTYGDCVGTQSDASYELYALDATYAKTLELSGFDFYDPAKDPKAYKANLKIQMPSNLVASDSGIEYQHKQYFVDSVNTSTKQLILVDGGVVTNIKMISPEDIVLIVFIILVMLYFLIMVRERIIKKKAVSR